MTTTITPIAAVLPLDAPVVAIRPLAVDATTAAAMVGRRPRTLEHWRRTGRGPRYVRADDGTLVYLVADLEAWLHQAAEESDARSAC